MFIVSFLGSQSLLNSAQPKDSHAFLGSVMPHIWGRISSATDTMIACIALPDQNNMKIASYSPHPPVHLPHHSKLSNIPGPSRSTLPLHSNLQNFRIGVNGTQLTSQTLFPMQKKNLTFFLHFLEGPRNFLNILFPEALFIRDLVRILLE